MSVKKGEQICRLCLKVAKNKFEKVDGFVKQIFDALFLKLNLDISKDPVICQDCVEVAKTCLVFKSNCIGVEKTILSFATVMEGGKVSIKFILKEIAFAAEELDICRFCLTRLERKNFVPLDTLMNQAMFEMLREYMPEIDFNIIENPIICTTCKEQLEDYFKFVLNSLDIERKIKSYYEEEGTDRMGQVKLSRIVQYSFKDIVEYPTKCPQICVINEELNTFEHTECVFPQACGGLIKHEELDIKEEELNLDQKSHKNLPEVHKEKNRVNGNKMYKCLLCPFETKQKRYLDEHMVVHKNFSIIKTYKWSLCAYKSMRKDDIKRHFLVHKNFSEITYGCSMCAYKTKQKGNLKTHMLVHRDISELNMYKCSLCAYVTKQQSSFKTHMIIHRDVSKIEIYKCPLGAYEARKKRTLRGHVLAHKKMPEIITYTCSLCGYEAEHKNRLQIHNISVHKDVSKMYKCSFCSYQTVGLRALP